MKTDAQIIDDLGGAAKVAEMLGFDPEIGTQRVHNWKARGIPAAIKLKHLDIFGHAMQCDCTQPPPMQEAA